MVKRSRHHPFTVVTGVRFPYGSPLYGSIAQLGEHLPYKQRVTGSSPVVPTIHGSVAQLVRVPACHAGSRGFEPLLSRHISGPLVKRSRHHPFTVVTGVRFPYGSPYAIIAQLVERRLAKAKVASSSLVYRSKRVLKINIFKTLFLFIESILILEIANDKILNSTIL